MLFGVHFSAIAGPGPLIGPVLAAQWGFLPGFTWIIIGACLAGGVHDFVVLVASVRCNGLSLPKIARNLLGPIAGTATTIATLFIIVATLAGVAKVVVNTLEASAWGMFTIVATIPAALITGFWMYKIRPGRVGEASIIGIVLVFLAVIFGKLFDDSAPAVRNAAGFRRETVVDHPAGLCGHRIDPAGLGAVDSAGLPELVHESRRHRPAGLRHPGCRSRG